MRVLEVDDGWTTGGTAVMLASRGRASLRAGGNYNNNNNSGNNEKLSLAKLRRVSERASDLYL